MRLWNSFKIAFAMYSKIPMPKADWEKEKMPYVLCCFPLIGVVIGFGTIGWDLICRWAGIGNLMRTAGLVLLPVLVTGGIHLDGFLDTCDARHSYRPVEEKLRILSDPHTGAFAIICAAALFTANLGIWSELAGSGIRCMACGFVLSRALSGFCVAVFPCAKNTGLASMFQSVAQKKTVAAVCLIEAAASIVVAGCLSLHYGILLAVAAGLVTVYYRYMAGKEFGGITGDLAGWFLQVSELVMALVICLGGKIWFS